MKLKKGDKLQVIEKPLIFGDPVDIINQVIEVVTDGEWTTFDMLRNGRKLNQGWSREPFQGQYYSDCFVRVNKRTKTTLQRAIEAGQVEP